MSPGREKGSLLRRLRRAYLLFGCTALSVFLVWNLWAFQDWGVPPGILADSPAVKFEETDDALFFRPADTHASTGMVFFPGGLVDPRAYAPLAHRLAAAGHPVVVVKIPLRGAFSSAATEAEVAAIALSVRERSPGIARWLAAGHSKGALFAARCVERSPEHWQGLALLGSSHPKDFSLAALTLPVLRVSATRDPIASTDRLESTARNLPAATSWVRIEGGNHSQFGHYGFQFGDRFARITREEQQDRIAEALLGLLAKTGRAPTALTSPAGRDTP